MVKTIKVTMNGKSLNVAQDVHIEELLLRAPHNGKFSPVAAVINNRLAGLYYRIKSPSEIETIDFSRREGMDVYRRTASVVLYAAAAEVSSSIRMVVGQSISNGYFFEVHGHQVDANFIATLEKNMKELVSADTPLEPEWITVEEAIETISQHNVYGNIKMLRQLRSNDVPLISLGNYRGVAYGPVASRTGLVDNFKIVPFEHGIVLNFPNENGEIENNIKPQPTLFSTYLETKRWNALVGIENVADLNERCMSGGAVDLVQVSEALQEKKISAIAEDIASKKDVHLILIAGPSGSGKTTFSKRLSIHLKSNGVEPVAISMDNYYINREDSPKHPDGSYDFECLEALDIGLFNEHMQKLMQGEEIDSPFFSFPMGRRDPSKSKKLKLKKGQVLLTEGIHGLNDRLTKAIPQANKYKIYTSALTQICLDDHNRIFTTDTRLCRRIIRDRLFRGTSAADTIAGWASVRAGENKYIFPFQESANIIFNSALSYEQALFKPYAERFLTEVPREHSSFMEAQRLVRFFQLFIPILTIEVPQTSIVREFIGGSVFKYN